MPLPIEHTGAEIDLSTRVAPSAVVVASPAAAAETIIASVTLPGETAVITGCYVEGFAAFTVGTNGTNSQLRIRRTNVAGAIVQATGALATAAASLNAPSINGFDAGAPAGTTYVLTLIVTAASAVSTVSGVSLVAYAL